MKDKHDKKQGPVKGSSTAQSKSIEAVEDAPPLTDIRANVVKISTILRDGLGASRK